MEITALLYNAQKAGASDVHLSPKSKPLMRLHGHMKQMDVPVLDGTQIKEIMYSIMSESQRANYEKELELDFAIQFGDNMRFRVNAFNTLHGPAAAFRTIPTDILSLDDLKAPNIFKHIALLEKGLVLVTGPTGSGKSTTLAAMVDYINTEEDKHIITVEDPIEFVHKSKKCLINQRELGVHTHSFARALKSALREDPDVILVGEMRDLDTIQLALTAAETGHLVMGTLHTNSAVKTIDRIIDAFPASDKALIRSMLSTSLEAVIAQKLLSRKDDNGRVAAHEILLGTPAIRNLIREGKMPQINSLIQVGSRMGMQSMQEAIRNLLNRNIIDSRTARVAMNVQDSENAVDSEDAKGKRSVAQIKQEEAKNDGSTTAGGGF